MSYKIPYFILLFNALFVSFDQSNAQNKQQIYYNESIPDSIRIDAAIDLANDIFYDDNDSAKLLIEQAKKWSLRSNYKKGLAQVDGFLGVLAHREGELANAIKFYRTSINYNLANGFELERAMDLGNYGTLLLNLNDSKSIHVLTESKDIYEANNKEEDLVYIYTNMASFYRNYMKVDSAFYYYYKAERINKNIRTSKNIALGLALLYLAEDDFENASYQVFRSLAFEKELKDSTSLGRSYEILTSIKYEMGDLDSAYYYGRKVESMLSHLEVIAKDQYFENMGKIYFERGDYKRAYQMIDSSLYYVNLTNSKDLKEFAFIESVRLELKQESISDSLAFIVANEQAKYDYQLKLEKETQKIWVLTIVLIATLLLALAIFFGYREKVVQNRIITEQKKVVEEKNQQIEVLIQEVHHRVKNNFQIICSVLRLQSNYLDNDEISKVFEDVVNRIVSMATVHEMFYKNGIIVNAEPDKYFNNLILNYKLSADGRQVNYIIETNVQNLNFDALISLGLIANELITNSLKYAFYEKNKEPEISIKLIQKGSEFSFSYHDNGPGFEQAKSKSSFGSELITTLAEQLNGKSSIDVNDGFSFQLLFSE